MREDKLTVKKVGTHNNPADLLTKAMNGEKVMKYVEEVGFDIAPAPLRRFGGQQARMQHHHTGRPQRRALKPKKIKNTVTRQ